MGNVTIFLGNIHIFQLCVQEETACLVRTDILIETNFDVLLIPFRHRPICTVQPDSYVIDNYLNGTSIVIRPPQQVILTCRANNAKPAATITWLKGGQPLVHDTPVVEVILVSTQTAHGASA